MAKFNIEMDDDHFLEVWKRIDRDGSGDMSYNEFLESFGKDIACQADSGAMANKMTSIRMAENEARKRPVAEHPDWEPKDIRKALANRMRVEARRVWKVFMAEDRDHDGALSYKEFQSVRCV